MTPADQLEGVRHANTLRRETERNLVVPTSRNQQCSRKPPESSAGYFYYAGFRYWTASLLPALVGTTLPFWLSPPGFTFKWLLATEFLFATVLFHAGFSFMQAAFADRSPATLPRTKLAQHAVGLMLLASVMGFLIDRQMQLRMNVYESIFIVYGISAIVVGLLYVAPPARLSRRIGGEIAIIEGLGMLPVLGAYLVQVGDLTRTVYLASLPIVGATGLWVWIAELASWGEDQETGRGTLVTEFGPRLSGRFGVAGIALVFIAALALAVWSGSVSPWALAILLGVVFVWRIAAVSWTDYLCSEAMTVLQGNAFLLHFFTCTTIIGTSLLSELA